jgi:hypothetical protein
MGRPGLSQGRGSHHPRCCSVRVTGTYLWFLCSWETEAVVDNFPWGVALAVFGVVVPIVAFLYEFVFLGRKRLGYRVQRDTRVIGEVPSQYAGALQ